MSHMANWNRLSKPPLSALKNIQAGRLKGKTDINPQWRYQAMTEVYGPCGIGWKYTIDNRWTEPGSENQLMCFVDISLFVKVDGQWSDAIPGSGGAMLVEAEGKGADRRLHTSDEGYKMATTDALSVAMKMLGVAAEVYLGNFDGSKYKTSMSATAEKPQTAPQAPAPTGKDAEYIDRVKTALKAIYGDDKQAALAKVEELTSFVPKGKTEAERVKGIRDFTKLTGQRLQILAHSLEKLTPAAAICNECRQPLVNGACRSTTCPEGRPEE